MIEKFKGKKLVCLDCGSMHVSKSRMRPKTIACWDCHRYTQNYTKASYADMALILAGIFLKGAK